MMSPVNIEKTICPSVIMIFVHIEDGMYIGQLREKTGMQQNYTSIIINMLKRKNFLKLKKEGRIKIITLTKKGLKMRTHLREAYKLWRT